MSNVSQLALLSVLLALGAERAQAQYASSPRDLDPLRGPQWGQGGPWADQEPYTPHPRPLGWVDPEPSRWPWTGSRDPYTDARSGKFKNAAWFGPLVQIVVLQGLLNEPVPFIARLKFPANANIPAHSHAGIQRVTVISGILNMGMGDNFETGKTHAFGSGSVTTILPTFNHFFWFSEETVIQVCGVGPWMVTYADPANDPRETHRPWVNAPP